MENTVIAASPLDITVRDWLPIETAPHDGTVIELLGENGKLDIGEWHEWSEHFDKTANEIAENVTGEFSTEYGEGPHTHWRTIAPNVERNRDARHHRAAPVDGSVRPQAEEEA